MRWARGRKQPERAKTGSGPILLQQDLRYVTWRPYVASFRVCSSSKRLSKVLVCAPAVVGSDPTFCGESVRMVSAARKIPILRQGGVRKQCYTPSPQ